MSNVRLQVAVALAAATAVVTPFLSSELVNAMGGSETTTSVDAVAVVSMWGGPLGAGSQGIPQASVVLANQGEYCLKDLGFAPSSAVASASGDQPVFLSVRVGRAGACPEGTQVTVKAWSVSGGWAAPQNGDFTVRILGTRRLAGTS